MNVCTHCGRQGHWAKDCTWPKKGNVKLHPEQVARIRKFIEEKYELQTRLNTLTDAALANRYGVVSQTIRSIRLGEAWIDV